MNRNCENEGGKILLRIDTVALACFFASSHRRKDDVGMILLLTFVENWRMDDASISFSYVRSYDFCITMEELMTQALPKYQIECIIVRVCHRNTRLHWLLWILGSVESYEE
jgi:hypothetical protein